MEVVELAISLCEADEGRVFDRGGVGDDDGGGVRGHGEEQRRTGKNERNGRTVEGPEDVVDGGCRGTKLRTDMRRELCPLKS